MPRRTLHEMSEGLSPALRAVSDAVLAVASQRSVEEVLQGLVDSARELAGARYAALGIPTARAASRRFLVAGMSDELIAALGPAAAHPRDARRDARDARRRTAPTTSTSDPRFRGWWPRGHPDMRSFLGVPIVAPEGVIGAFYLTDKEGADDFDDADQELIELLAAHAAIAITNARLYERSRELSMLAERNRLALELHDAVSQKLFGLVLDRRGRGHAARPRPGARRATQVARLQDARAGGAGRAALADLRAAPARPRARRARAARCASTSRCCARLHERRRSSSTSTTACAGEPSATARCCGSPRRRCTTRCATRGATHVAVRLPAATGGSCSRWPTTAPASTRPTPSCARGGSG